MKTGLKFLVFFTVVIFLFSGCVSTQVSETADYSIEVFTTSIEIRDSELPVTVVMPVGDGRFPLVVMAHGHGGSKEENGGFTNIAEELGKYGIASIRMDFPGCGESKESFQLNTLSNMIDDVDAALEYVIDNYAVDSGRLGIFGYSMGGRVALTMATDNKYSFDGMVLLAPAVDKMTMINFLGGQEAWDNYYTEAKANGYTVFTTIWGSVQELSLEWFEDQIILDPIDRAGEYSGEALVIYGEDDYVVDPMVSKATAEALGSPVLDVTGDTHSYSFYSDKPDIRSAIINGTIETFRKAFN